VLLSVRFSSDKHRKMKARKRKRMNKVTLRSIQQGEMIVNIQVSVLFKLLHSIKKD
jgi:hypothetical protein